MEEIILIFIIGMYVITIVAIKSVIIEYQKEKLKDYEYYHQEKRK